MRQKDERPRAAVADPSDPLSKRRKLIDDTDASVKLQELSKVSPWVPQFTPHCDTVAPAPKPPQVRPRPDWLIAHPNTHIHTLAHLLICLPINISSWRSEQQARFPAALCAPRTCCRCCSRESAPRPPRPRWSASSAPCPGEISPITQTLTLRLTEPGPVSLRKTITTQKVVMLKSTGAIMLETAFKELVGLSCPPYAVRHTC